MGPRPLYKYENLWVLYSFDLIFNTERLLHLVDSHEGREGAGEKANCDESDDEEDVDLKPQGSTPPPLSAVLSVYQDDEIDLCFDELAEILADGPISRPRRPRK